MRAVVMESLRANGFRCVGCPDISSARTAIHAYAPAALICDLGLPGNGAHELCQYVRSAAGTPTLMLAARPDETEELMAFAAGAEDYVAWPTSARVLAARVRVATRRTTGLSPRCSQTADMVRHESIELVRSTRQVSVGGHAVHLTRTEFDLLALLMDSPYVVWSRPDLVRAVWGQWMGDDHLLEVHLSRLRTKIQAAGGPVVAQAVRGVGYRLTHRASPAPAVLTALTDPWDHGAPIAGPIELSDAERASA